MMKGRFKLFECFSMFILAVVAIFISICLGAVIIGGFSSLRESLFSDEIQFAIKLSLTTATISTLICLFLAIPCAYTLSRKDFPAKRWVTAVLTVPLSLPYLVLGLCLLIVFSSQMGQMLRDAGFRVVFDTTGIVIAHRLVNLPFVIKLITEAFSEVDPRLEFIAGTLGADEWKRFLTITLGMTKRAILSAGILAWSRALGEFGATLMLVGVTRMVTETLPAAIYLNISTGDNDMAMAAATILIVISLLTLIITESMDKKRSRTVRS